MFAAVRRKLRQIRYYSARREETVWTRAVDRLLFASLGLAIPAALVCNMSVGTPHMTAEQDGMFVQRDDGQTVASPLGSDAPVGGWPAASFGRFSVRAVETHRGWPFVTSILQRPAQLMYDMFHEVDSRLDVGRSEDAHLRDAVDTMLRRQSQEELWRAWKRESNVATLTSPLRWFFASVAWWVLLYIAGVSILTIVRAGVFVYQWRVQSQARRWRRAGCCAACGYNLRGAEFSARCPECGHLAQ